MLAMKPVVLKFVFMRGPFWEEVTTEESNLEHVSCRFYYFQKQID